VSGICRDDQQVLPRVGAMAGEDGERFRTSARLDQLHDVFHEGSAPDHEPDEERHSCGASLIPCLSVFHSFITSFINVHTAWDDANIPNNNSLT